MFRLFKKRTNPSPASTFWIRMSGFLGERLRQMADRLNKHAQRWPLRAVRIGLVIFCMLYAGFSVYLIVRGVRGTGGKIEIDHFAIPEHVIINESSLRPAEAPILSHREYERMIGFRRYMDSLRQDPAGFRKYSEILQQRPGLMDSLQFIISLYEGEEKK